MINIRSDRIQLMINQISHSKNFEPANYKLDENIIGVVVLMEKLFLYKEFLNEDELHELTQFYSINYDDLKAEQRLYKNQMNNKKMNFSEVTELFLENNFHIALSSMNELFKILWTISVNSCEM
jgi:hypothetical protein